MLWDDFRKGDKYALSHIYYQYVDLLYRYGKKFSRDNDLVKDAIQDLFYDLIRTRKTLGPTNNILFYLMRSLRRKLVQNMKRDQLPENVKENSELELNIVYSFEEELIAREDLSRREQIIKECLMELNPRQREILYYRYTCNLDYDQICELMSLKYDSARKLVFRAIITLRKMMGDSVNLQLFFCIFRK